MAQFASSTFTGTAFTELSALSAVWSKQNSYTRDLILGSTGAYMIAATTGAAAGVYQHSGSPASADYTVSADIAKLPQAGDCIMGVCGRMQAGAQTLYYVIYTHASTNIRLFKIVSGSQTQLGSSYSYTLTGTAANLLLRMSGDQISVELNASTVIGPVTDTAITTAGKAGVYGFDMRVSGVADVASLDNFSADDIGGGGGGAVPNSIIVPNQSLAFGSSARRFI